MEIHLVLLVFGLAVTFWGIGLNTYARMKFRTAAAPGLWPQVRPSQWRTRREWFSSEHGYRLSRRGALLISIGGAISLIAAFL